MREHFRQSMLLLHSWCGLTAGWLLFFVFVTGTAGFVSTDLSRWMRPELPMASVTPSASDALSIAERYLTRNASGAGFWSIYFPGYRDNGEFAVTWSEGPGGINRGEIKRVILDGETGERDQRQVRQTGGGRALYAMHYALHYISRDAATVIVGVAAMIMLISVLSGIIGHRAIFKNFRALPAARGSAQRRALHAALGTIGLPFFFVMAWSGLLFSLFVYMPVAQSVLFSDTEAEMRFNVEAYFPPDRPYGERALVVPPSIAEPQVVLDKAEELWGRGEVSHIRVDNPGRENVRVTAYTRGAHVRAETRAAFDADTGEAIYLTPPRTATAKFLETMAGLHKANFAGSYLRALYVLCGLAGIALVATGLVQWTMKRKHTGVGHFSIVAVDKINLATVIGFPLGFAGYFWANRVLPVGLINRADWEVHTIFLVWGVALLYALLRRADRAWPEMCIVAGAAYGLLPVLNALTTERHLGVTLPAGDWALAAVDLTALGIGGLFAVLARALWRRRHHV